jgi:hypothetical protein
MTRLMWKLDSVHSEIVVILTQNRFTVCAKHTKAPKSFWMHPVVLLGDEAQEQARFSPF